MSDSSDRRSFLAAIGGIAAGAVAAGRASATDFTAVDAASAAVKPGEVVFLELPQSMSRAEADLMHEALKSRIPDIRFVLLGGGVRVGHVGSSAP